MTAESDLHKHSSFTQMHTLRQQFKSISAPKTLAGKGTWAQPIIQYYTPDEAQGSRSFPYCRESLKKDG